MNNRFYLSAVFCIIFGFFTVQVSAQTEGETQGEIEDVQVEIVKDREIVLPPAVRKFDKVPPQDDVQERPAIRYTYPTPNIRLSPLDLRLRPLRIKDEPLQKTYGNYIAAGFGNYATPYVEGFINSKREKTYTYGLHGKYLSSYKGPVDGKNSGDGLLEVDVFGTYFGRIASLSGDLGFRRRNMHFYGYPEGIEVERDTIKQHYNHIFAAGTLEGTNSRSPYQYNFNVAVDHLTDNYDGRETQAGFSWLNRYALNDDVALQVDLSYDFINYENQRVSATNRHLFKIQPRVKFSLMDFAITAGFNAAYENDTIEDSGDLHFYPFAAAEYALAEQWKVFAKLDGDIQKNTLEEFSYENPYLGPENHIFHSNKTFDFSGGIKGRLGQKVGWTGGVSIQAYKNLYFYVNNDQQPAQEFYPGLEVAPHLFSVIYDRGNTNIFSIFTEVSIIATEDLYANFNARWNSYNTGDLEAAYHKPEYSIEADLFYQLVDKINFKFNFYGLGGITAINESGNNTTLDPALDLNVKIDYLLSDRVSIFGRFNNLFSQNYMLLNRYEVRGFQALGGITYNF